MLRISEIGSGREAATLRLEGEVKVPWVKELEIACERLLAEARPVTLDLAEVSFVEREAVGVLIELMRREVKLINCSPFIAEQIKVASSSRARSRESY